MSGLATAAPPAPPPVVRPSEPESVVDPAAVEAATKAHGKRLWARLGHRRPSLFEQRYWDDRLMEWAMADESVKVQAFRFVDVLPTLRTHAAVTEHLREYFDQASEFLPSTARAVLAAAGPGGMAGRALSLGARWNARRMAERFIAGESTPEVLKTVERLRRDGFAFTLDLLGEAVIGEREADRYAERYLELIEGLADAAAKWPDDPQLDTDHRGPIPRVNVSLKLSALTAHFAQVDPAGTFARVAGRLRPILRKARDRGAFVNFDAEQYAYKNLTLSIARRILTEDEFADWEHAGVVVQAYLRDAEADLHALRGWAAERGTAVTVRLVKGAYWDYETVTAAARNWPVPVYRRKWQSDASFERCTDFLMGHHDTLRPAIASHNLRSLSHALAAAEAAGVPHGAWEAQMLFGMAADQADLLAELGHRVRIYTPFGEPIPGMAYLVRRLLENTSNDSFLRHSYDPDVDTDDLFMSPAALGERTSSPDSEEVAEPAFRNEPLTDFGLEEHRDAMAAALAQVEDELGWEYPLVIGGRNVQPNLGLVSYDPSSKKTIVGKVAAATPKDAAAAVEAAHKAFPAWSRTPAGHRAEYLELLAGEMRHRRFELAAWMVREVGKPWAEADAEVAEAIDFCVYYAVRMRELAAGRRVHVPGEENHYFYRPRGVAVVIAPWNFPLAILTGMTAAALVTGNTVVMKPAEQSPIIAAKLMDLFREIGLPDGVVNYLPGVGDEVGPPLIAHPDTAVVAFTGSRAVGLALNAEAAKTPPTQDHVKQVIAELGGKNAIIVDADADLDEAVLGVTHGAFGYAGQKCSACSRAIVLADCYDAFLERLTGAVESLTVGPAGDPGTEVGPVIDAEAADRLRKATATTAEPTETAVSVEVPDLSERGHFVGPHVFTEVPTDSRLATDELFGPVLAVFRVKDFDEAIDLANATDYALTAGVYSRSPQHLEQARRELVAGNIYLNRGITGALVNRQPFGGYKLSGVGSKAGGPDYLLQFLVPVNVTENTMRRGFAPEAGE